MVTKQFFIIPFLFLSHVSIARTLTYYPDNAVNYARSWVSNSKTLRNSTYPDFSSSGGDCTNFVSQALKAGGLTNTATDKSTSDTRWFYVDKKNYSQTWSTANGLYTRMKNGNADISNRKTNSYEDWVSWSGLGSLNYGDIVFADWTNSNYVSHTMIVTGFHRMDNGIIEARLSYHSNDTKDITITDFKARIKSYPNAKFYRFGKQNSCLIPQPYQIF